jgi:hypothetical protein
MLLLVTTQDPATAPSRELPTTYNAKMWSVDVILFKISNASPGATKPVHRPLSSNPNGDAITNVFPTPFFTSTSMAKRKRPRTFTSGEGGASNNTKPVKESQLEASVNDELPSLDWIAALASKATSSAANGNGVGTATTKEERIERRMRKKQRRQMQKDQIHEKMKGKQCIEEDYAAQSVRAGLTAMKGRSAAMTARKGNNRTKLVDKERLERIASLLKDRVLATGVPIGNHQRPSRPFEPQRTVKTSASSLLPAQFRKRKWELSSLQPRKRDYGGIGLARPTLFLELTDPSFVPKLEEEFHEHIPGFYGRSVFHNSQKRQSSQNALWRTISDRAKASTLKVDGKRLSDMHPDERVEAMLRAGLI